ncbi:MAG: type II toxin-antitoxin system VapC family toxin [Blastocatellia bacterium]|nr:type II toxin-antitoxin system VapC family toxin [Blastocatellia bacterium]
MSQPINPGAVVVDSNILVSISSKETTIFTAQKALADYTAKNWSFYAPGVVVAESLFVLCRKLSDGILTPADYDKAIEVLKKHLGVILQPPSGDTALTQRAKEIQNGYSCLHSADCLYLALTEELAKSRPAEFLTFDKRVVNVAAKNAPSVKVNLLPS